LSHRRLHPPVQISAMFNESVEQWDGVYQQVRIKKQARKKKERKKKEEEMRKQFKLEMISSEQEMKLCIF
jgi:hypothetical protein